MTISPPSKVNTGIPLDPEVLCSGVDSLYFTLDIVWPDDIFFQVLEMFQTQARKTRMPHPIFIEIPDMDDRLLFNVLPNGTIGYKWIISGNEFAVRFSNQLRPNSRPNAIVEIRSETLWRRGIPNSIDVILAALKEWSAHIIKVKPNRIDLCMDLFIPSHYWDVELFNHTVTRSRNINHYFKSNILTGVSIGKGKLSARLYDKELEIQTISKKLWMHKVWRIDEIPENKKVIRVEFQIMREALKELGIDDLVDGIGFLDSLWGYCTKKWLKFRSNPGKHHTQRKTLPWWSKVQNSFQGVCEPVPAIRAKAVRTTQLQLSHQLLGIATSLAATDDDYGRPSLFDGYTLEHLSQVFWKAVRLTKITNEKMIETVNHKRARNHRGKLSYQVKNYDRLAQGLPADLLTLATQEDLTWELYDDAP